MAERPKLPPCSLSVYGPDPFLARSLLSLSHSETTCSINTRCRQNRGNLTGQRECENKRGGLRACLPMCLCPCPCAYMQPEQRLLLYRCWISRKPAADESKHFLHGEGQRAQLDIKHLTVGQMYSRVYIYIAYK